MITVTWGCHSQAPTQYTRHGRSLEVGVLDHRKYLIYDACHKIHRLAQPRASLKESKDEALLIAQEHGGRGALNPRSGHGLLTFGAGVRFG